MFDYSKYENATRKEILRAISLAEKRAKRLAEKTRENEKIFTFLKSKLDDSFKENRKTKEQRIIPELDKAIEEYKRGEYIEYKDIEDYLKHIDD